MTSQRRRILFVAFFGLVSVPTTFGYADNDQIKKLLFSDCQQAKTALTTLPNEEKAAVVTFIGNILKVTDVPTRELPAPPPGATNKIGTNNSTFDEPKIGELVTINNTERENKAKVCALESVVLLAPESYRLFPNFFEAERAARLTLEIIQVIPRTISESIASLASSEISSRLIPIAVQELEVTDSASAENILLELAPYRLHEIMEHLVSSVISIEKVASYLTYMVLDSNQLLPIAKELVGEGARKRQLGLILLESTPSDTLQNDAPWAKMFFENALIPEFLNLQRKLLPLYSARSNTWVSTLLRNNLKGSDKDGFLRILHLSTGLDFIPQELQTDLALGALKYTLKAQGGDFSNEDLVALSLIAEKDTQRTKWKGYLSYLLHQLANISEDTDISLHTRLLVNSYADIKDEIGKKINATADVQWYRYFSIWATANRSEPSTWKTTLSFLKKTLTSKNQLTLETAISELFTSSNTTQKSERVKELKKLTQSKIESERFSAVRILSVAEPKTLNAMQYNDLLLKGRCEDLNRKEFLPPRSSLTPAQIFDRALFCLQTNQRTIDQVIELVSSDSFSKAVRDTFIIQTIQNQLFDRRFRADLLDRAAILHIEFSAISDVVGSLLKDSDPEVLNKTLSAIAQFGTRASSLVPTLLSLAIENTAQQDKDQIDGASYRISPVTILVLSLKLHTEDLAISVSSIRKQLIEQIKAHPESTTKNLQHVLGLPNQALIDIAADLLEDLPVEQRSAALEWMRDLHLTQAEQLVPVLTKQLSSTLPDIRNKSLLVLMSLGVLTNEVQEKVLASAFTAQRSEIFLAFGKQPSIMRLYGDAMSTGIQPQLQTVEAFRRALLKP